MLMIEQCKGKDITNIAQSKLAMDKWIATIKYDGNYVQIHKFNGDVEFYTSGGKQFYIKEIADYLCENNPDDFILECEYVANTDGKLGSRVKCSTGNLRSNFEKNIPCIGTFRFVVFDIIHFNGSVMDWSYSDRIRLIDEEIELPPDMMMAQIVGMDLTIDQAKQLAHKVIKQGYEGIYCKQIDHTYEPGKRVNTAIKIKFRPTADLHCIDVTEGTGKYSGMIGSLVLKDKAGRVVQVGSGLTDYERMQSPDYFIGKVIEVEYEQLLATYIQPTFVRVRDDKSIEDID
nr:MAG TPA: Thermostable DNA ligase [Caudoviricetes sp.]